MLVIETCAAAGLLTLGHTDELDAAWLPTAAFDIWVHEPVAQRWVRLARAWLDNPRLTSAVGSKLQGKLVNALSADLERSWLATTRRETLGELAGIPDGEVLAPGTGVPSLAERVAWLRPGDRPHEPRLWPGSWRNQRSWAWSGWAGCRPMPAA